MAASAPVALGIAGVAAVLLVSGIKGKDFHEILQGDFGSPSNAAGDGESGTGSVGPGGQPTEPGSVNPTHSSSTGPDAPNPITLGTAFKVHQEQIELSELEQIVKKDFPKADAQFVEERAKVLLKDKQSKL